MLATKAFFSFLELTDPTKHRVFNEYHQLDHRPENLALPGVVWGDRWVRTPACRAASRAGVGDLGRIHYVAMYWFGEPLDASVARWSELGDLTFQLGRRPDVGWARRDVGFFRPLKGVAHPRVLVSPDALVFRPVRGLHLTVTRLHEPGSPRTQELHAWHDRVRVPDLLGCRGVAGAWTFASHWSTLDDREGLGAVRVTLLYLDDDPAAFLADLTSREPEWERAGRGFDAAELQETLLETPLLPITPWQWNWFDNDGQGGDR